MIQQSGPDNPPAVTMQGSDNLYQWLENENISFAFTTYQANRLFLVGRKENRHLAVMSACSINRWACMPIMKIFT